MKLVHIALASALSAAPAASAATFTVTNTEASGAGSFRQALLDANAASGADTVTFAIGGDGPHRINVAEELPPLAESITIDGTTQPGYAGTPLVSISGWPVRPTLVLGGGPSLIRGLTIAFTVTLAGTGGHHLSGNVFDYWVRLESDGNVVEGNRAGPLDISSDDNVVRGNRWQRITGESLHQCPQVILRRVDAEGASREEREEILHFAEDDPCAEAGPAWDRRPPAAVEIRGDRNQIGGSSAGEGNVIGPWHGPAIIIPSGSGNIVQGNAIANVTFENYNELNAAVELESSGNVIGGFDPAAGNVITNVRGYGVKVFTTGNAILSNSIHHNQLAPIAHNWSLPAPGRGQLCDVVRGAAETVVSGIVRGPAFEPYTIQLFANTSLCEAETLLGTGAVTTGPDGFARWELTVPPTSSTQISLTVTDGDNTTSVVDLCTMTCRRTPSDFNGDGRSDLFWRNTKTGENSVWFMSGATIAGGVNLPSAPPSYQPYLGDFNGDGRTDIYWWNPEAVDANVWCMNGGAVTGCGDPSNKSTKGVGWQVLVGEFTSDGRADLLWRQMATGKQEVWAAPLYFYQTGPHVSPDPPPWQSRTIPNTAVADGVLWRLASTGHNSIWRMGGVARYVITGAGDITFESSDWTPSLGDTDGDGHGDILWRDVNTGALKFWFLRGVAVTRIGSFFFNVPAPRVMYRGDFNGDLRLDVLWRNPVDGENAIWFLDGNRIIGGGNAPPITAPDWILIGAQ